MRQNCPAKVAPVPPAFSQIIQAERSVEGMRCISQESFPTCGRSFEFAKIEECAGQQTETTQANGRPDSWAGKRTRKFVGSADRRSGREMISH